MPRRPRRESQDIPTLEPTQLDGSGPAPDDVEAEQAIQALIDETPGGAQSCKVVVFKRSADGNKILRCKRFPLDKFDIDDLPALYGGGDFALRVVDAQGRHLSTIRVAFDPSIPKAAPEPVAPAAAVPVVSGLSEARLTQLENALRDSETRHTKFLESLVTAGIGKSPAVPVDPFAQIRGAVDLVKEMSGGRTPASEIAQAMKTALDFARDARGEGEGGEADPVLSLIQTIAPKIVEALTTAGTRTLPAAATPARAAVVPRAPAPGPVGMMPGPAPASSPAPVAPPQLPPEWAGFEFLRGHVDVFLRFASKGTQPELIGQLAYQDIEDRYLNDLRRFVLLPAADQHTLFSQLDPRLVPYMDWLDLVTASIREEFEAENEPDNVSAK